MTAGPKRKESEMFADYGNGKSCYLFVKLTLNDTTLSPIVETNNIRAGHVSDFYHIIKKSLESGVLSPCPVCFFLSLSVSLSLPCLRFPSSPSFSSSPTVCVLSSRNREATSQEHQKGMKRRTEEKRSLKQSVGESLRACVMWLSKRTQMTENS